MEIAIRDTVMMGILLLEPCNFECPHCVRSDEPMARGYRLTFDQLRRCLEDCRALEKIETVHFSGGEPTLWREDGKDLVDLLTAIADAGFTPRFTTNGSAFLDVDACARFFEKFLERTEERLVVYVSVDTFHGNFDRNAGRAPCLDALAEWREGVPDSWKARVELQVITVVSKNPATLLPEGMVEGYEARGMKFGFIPLKEMGKARASLSEECPRTGSDDPEDWGAFSRFRTETGGSLPDSAKREAHRLALIDEDYFLPLVDENRGDLWPRAGRLGALPAWILRAFAADK
ncbi:MAG: radical SAM protein [Planctomycetota bacterium]|jgi:MoaA/NifB/PqqE/SkfB family radical SAM enzyme